MESENIIQNAEETNNDTNDIASDTQFITNEETITNEQTITNKKRNRFQETKCNHCSKIFKSKITYDKHITQQLCYTQKELTYCKVCNITHETNEQYIQHLFTMQHINNIGYNKHETINNEPISQVHVLDPYLNTNDINNISKTNLGESFTFVFEKGNTQTVSLINPIVNTIINPINITTSTTNTNNNPSINNNNQNSKIHEITPRQQKVILFLEKQVSELSPSDSGKQFYKMLDNKLQLDDFKSLQNIIKNLTIPDNFKDMYLKVIEIFISVLVKEKSKGSILYKDKDISQLVMNLTC